MLVLLRAAVRRDFSTARKRSTTIHKENSRFIGTNRFGHFNYVPPKIANFELFTGDLVQVRSNAQSGGGRPLPDQGKQARIKFVDRQKCLLFLPELNVQEELIHVASAYKQPTTVIRAQPYDYEDVELVNPVTGVPCRQGFEWRKMEVNGYSRAVRVDVELGTVIPVPHVVHSAMKERRPSLSSTKLVEARRVTYTKHPLFDTLNKERQQFEQNAAATFTGNELPWNKLWEKQNNLKLVESRQKAIQKLDEKRERFLTKASETLTSVFDEKRRRENPSS
ncbi:hypothetical protein BASA81_010547 [Batrachochytrium salamandrivorans]|nr:hypothetical protein BASA81_010547 [Batrachochytrium salamandrivorans]